MRRPALALLVMTLCGDPLIGVPPRENLPLQEMRAGLNDLSFQVHGHQAEMDLFQERVAKLEALIEKLNCQMREEEQNPPLEGRLAKLEKGHEALVGDLKSLKQHLNETNSSIATCQTKLTQIDQQLSSDVKSLKRSLETMLALLQKKEDPPGEAYVVKQGDSLGQIALDHKTDIKTLKQLNNLSSDTIYVGQRLSLPQ